MQHTINSEVFGVLNITTGDRFLRIEQTALDGTKSELCFPPAVAADIALQALYTILKETGGQAVAAQSPFYGEVKKML